MCDPGAPRVSDVDRAAALQLQRPQFISRQGLLLRVVPPLAPLISCHYHYL